VLVLEVEDACEGLRAGRELRVVEGASDALSLEPDLALLPVDALLFEVRAGLVERAIPVELEAGAVVPGGAALEEFQAVRLVVAGEQRPATLAAALDEPELDRPPRRSRPRS